MKSISPSAIILGPMLGIFMEAVIIELVVWLVGRHMVGYILAGALAVVWTLMQNPEPGNSLRLRPDQDSRGFLSISGQTNSIYRHTHNADCCADLWCLCCFWWVVRFFGYRTGSNFNHSPPSIPTVPKPGKQQENPFFGIDPSHPYSFLNLALVLVAIVLNLYLINSRLYLFAAISGFLFMFFAHFAIKGHCGT